MGSWEITETNDKNSLIKKKLVKRDFVSSGDCFFPSKAWLWLEIRHSRKCWWIHSFLITEEENRALGAWKFCMHHNRLHEKQKLNQTALQKEIHLYEQIQPWAFSEFRKGQNWGYICRISQQCINESGYKWSTRFA